MIWTPQAFLAHGITYAKKQSMESTPSTGSDFFRSSFGVSPDVCSISWELMTARNLLPAKAMPEHLLWALMFMKTYETETFLAHGLVGKTEKTLRKWVWLMISAIAQLYSFTVSLLRTQFIV